MKSRWNLDVKEVIESLSKDLDSDEAIDESIARIASDVVYYLYIDAIEIC